MLLSIKSNTKGFSLIELIIYISLLSVLLTASVLYTINIINIKSKLNYQNTISQNINNLVNQINYIGRSASSIVIAQPNQICLQSNTGNINNLYLLDQQVFYRQGDCDQVPGQPAYTSSSINITNFDFSNLSTSGSSNFAYSITISTPTNIVSSWQSSQSITSAIELRSQP